MKKLLALVIPSLLLLISCAAPSIRSSEIPNSLSNDSPVPGNIVIDQTYCTTSEGVALKMDIRFPKDFVAPAPVVVYAHGGGWTGGDKTDGIGLLFAPALLEQGYIFISINYRLAPEYKFPAQIEDLACAVRHLRSNSTRYGLDPERIILIGSSAGGHLVSLLGVVGDKIPWQLESYAEPYRQYSNQVAAVVDLYGPTDLASLFSHRSRSLSKRVFGVDDLSDPKLALFSPVNHVTSTASPFLILHGTNDQSVSPEQSQIFYEHLLEAGVPANLVMVKHAGHGFESASLEIDPSLDELQVIVISFLNSYLK